MAEKNVLSDEDYLDSLLKSITGESSEDGESSDFDEQIENDFVKSLEWESQGKDENDFLSGIENDLFASDNMSDNPDKTTEDGFDGISSKEDDNKYDIEDKYPEEKKPAKRKLFGRNKKNKNNKKIVISDTDAVENEAEEKNEITPTVDEELLASLENIITTDETGMEEYLSEELSKTDNESNETPEEQLNGLMDILGTTGEEIDDGVNLDNKKTKKKKGIFSKKKKSKQRDKNAVDAGNVFENAAEANASDAGEAFDVGGDNFEPQAESQNESKSSLLDFGNGEEKSDFDFGLDFGEIDFGEFGNNDAKELDENEHLIRQMDRGEIDEDELLEKTDEKKSKKEKKKKVKKAKKPAKKKAKKVKKVKQKDPDVIIPVSKSFIIFAASLVVLLVVVLIFGGKLNYYSNKMNAATTYYVDKKYSEAYSEISGMDIKDDDIAFYNQIYTIMLVMRHYDSGKSLVTIDDYEHALDSYLKGVSAYDKYQNQGREYGCFDEMTEVLGWIDIELKNTYELSESEARELILIEDSEEYAYKVRVLAKKARERNTEEEQ